LLLYLPLLLQVLDFDPDVLLLTPCSRSPAAAMPDVQKLTQQPGFADLAAVKSGQTYVIDHALFSRPGPRLWDGVELLAGLLYGGCSISSSSSNSSTGSSSTAVVITSSECADGRQQQQPQQAEVLKLLGVAEGGAVRWGPVTVQPLL
jgi:ABC-type Fe3+-hydroxamate transport system substrate-binding protein